MSKQYTSITQEQFTAIAISNGWEIVELGFDILRTFPGIQRKHDLLGGFISGDSAQSKALNGSAALMGLDILAYEPRPKTKDGEGSVNVYHYIIKRSDSADMPFILAGPYRCGALLDHWPAELDLSPYEQRSPI